MPLTNSPITAPPINSAVGVGQPRIHHHHDRGAKHVAEERRPRPIRSASLPERIDADAHPENGHGGPHRRTASARIAEPRREVVRQPDHHAIIAEVLYAAEDHHAEADARRCAHRPPAIRSATLASPPATPSENSAGSSSVDAA